MHLACKNAWEEAMQESDAIEALNKACKKLVNNVNHVSVPVKIRQEVETRWMSRYLLMRDICGALR